jgi:F0F1-type ATP synthase membrane subunit b/b'
MIILGTVLIFVLYRALARTLFAPFLEHLECREGVTAGSLFTADQMRQKAEALRHRYDDALFQTRVEANREKAEIIALATSEGQALIDRAEAQAGEELAAGRALIDRQVSAAQTRSEEEVRALADTLASRVDAQLTVH